MNKKNLTILSILLSLFIISCGNQSTDPVTGIDNKYAGNWKAQNSEDTIIINEDGSIKFDVMYIPSSAIIKNDDASYEIKDYKGTYKEDDGTESRFTIFHFSIEFTVDNTLEVFGRLQEDAYKPNEYNGVFIKQQ